MVVKYLHTIYTIYNGKKNTDNDGHIHIKVTSSNVYIYKDASRSAASLVASGNRNGTEPVQLLPVNNSELSGIFTVTGTTNTARISAIPILTARKLRAQQEHWSTQDTQRETPIIDPDVICPGDIIYPHTDANYISKGDEEKLPIDLWTIRKEALESKEDSIKTTRENQLPSPIRSISESIIQLATSPHNEIIGTTTEGNNLLIKINADGVTPENLFISNSEGHLSSPKGMAFDAENNFYVVDNDKTKKIQF